MLILHKLLFERRQHVPNGTVVKEVMRGHLEECLEHLKKRFNSKIQRGQRGRPDAVRPLMDFCEVNSQTALKWMDENIECPLPRGKFLIKIHCFLDFHGYKVIGFERMPKVLRNFAELIGYGVLSSNDAYPMVGYYDSQQIYQVIWEREGLSKEKEARMWEIWKERRDELEQKKLYAFENQRLEILFKLDSSTEQLSQQGVLALDLATGDGSRRLALINILKGTVGFFDGGLFDNLSSSEISDLKQNGGHTIHRLAAHLSNLSLKISAPEEE